MTHLSPDSVSKLMIGEATLEERQHAAECTQCALELRRLKETFFVFGHSVRAWAAESGAPLVPEQPLLRNSHPGMGFSPLRWALVSALLILLISLPLYRGVRDERRRAKELEDTLLLEQVNKQLSRDVSLPMEPFMNLFTEMSADSVGDRQ
jgi:hypothetical protein